MTQFADPHQTLWVGDLPWWDRPREFLSPQQQLDLDVLRLKRAGFCIVIRKRSRESTMTALPRLDDFWYARLRGSQKLVLSGAINQNIAFALWVAQDGCCGYCKRRTYLPARPKTKTDDAIKATIDHRRALSCGGSWKRYNLILACAKCNTAKGNLDEAAFREIVARFPPEPSGRHMSQIQSYARNEIGRRAKLRSSRP